MSVDPQISPRISQKLLARNAGFNLIGLATPMIAALATIPLLIRILGDERFGFVTIAWVVVGYFGLFDMGLGRALTKHLAARAGKDDPRKIASLTWTALVIMTGLGVVGAILIAGLAPWLVQSALRISPDIQEEARRSLYLLAASLPFIFLTVGLRGILEAQQSFGLVNAMRVPMGLFNYLGPVAVLPFSRSLVPVIGVLLVGRIIACLAHLGVCLRVWPALRERPRVRLSEMRPLLKVGGWMTVSNIVSPLMTYIDRFFIGTTISMTAVTYYVTPYEMITKFWFVPSALVGVLFPAFATSYADDREHTRQLFDRGLRAVFLIMFPVTLVVVTLAPEALALWLGRDFSAASTRVLQWLAAGVFVNSLGQVPFSMLQGIGRPDLTGKLHLLELPFYVAGIWWMAARFGIQGVAMAWALRVGVDTLLLFLAAKRLLPDSAPDLRRTGQLAAVALGILAIAALDSDLTLRLAFLSLGIAVFCVLGWFYILNPTERALVRG